MIVMGKYDILTYEISLYHLTLWMKAIILQW